MALFLSMKSKSLESGFFQPKNGVEFEISELWEKIGGLVLVLQLTRALVLISDQDWMIKNLPYNSVATDLARKFHPDCFLYGDVVACPVSEVAGIIQYM